MFGLKIKYLSFFFILISIFSFFNIIYSYYLNLYLNLDTYYLCLIVSASISIIFYKIKIPNRKFSIFNKIFTVFFGYIIIPVILSIPFYFSIYNLTLLDSIFESISGFTSTGFTIFENIKHIDQSLILWRASVQWIGGLYFLFSIICNVYFSFLFGFSDLLNQTLLPSSSKPIIEPVLGQCDVIILLLIFTSTKKRLYLFINSPDINVFSKFIYR